MTEIKLYKSRWKGIKLIALSVPFVIAGIWMISKEQKGTFDYFMGWFAILFFGLGILLGIFIIFDRKPQIIISENGIWDRSLKQEQINWEQIKETYPIDINNQKFISIVVDQTFEFKKKQYKWIGNLNKFIGVQRLNLNLSQIKIDEVIVSELLNKIINSEKNERLNHIRMFSSSQKLMPNFEIQNYFIYFIILILFAIFSLSHLYAFFLIIILMGLSAIIVKWFDGTNNNTALYRYSRVMTYLGFINMIILLLIIKVYDYTSNKIGIDITNEIELYKNKFGEYPNDINNVRKKLNLNLFQNYIADKIEYKKNTNDFSLKLEFLNQNQKEFDSDLNEWN